MKIKEILPKNPTDEEKRIIVEIFAEIFRKQINESIKSQIRYYCLS